MIEKLQHKEWVAIGPREEQPRQKEHFFFLEIELGSHERIKLLQIEASQCDGSYQVRHVLVRGSLSLPDSFQREIGWSSGISRSL